MLVQLTLGSRFPLSFRDSQRVQVPGEGALRRVRSVRPAPQVRGLQRLRQVLHLPQRDLAARAGLRARPRLQ